MLNLTSSHGNFVLGQQSANYNLTVSNALAAGSTSGTVGVTDTLPIGLSLVTMTGTGWTCASNTCSRSDVLAAGTSYSPITVTVNVAAHATSPQINTATVFGGGWASASASDWTTIIGVPTLSIAKSHAGNFMLGQQGIYTLTISNASGAGPTSGMVSVSDVLPNGLTLALIGGTGWSCSGNTCSRSDILGPGASYPALTATISVATHATSPQINSATVSGGGSATASTADSTTITGVPILAIAKTHSGNFGVGQTGANYSLTVSNASGAGPTSGTVSVTDDLPSGLSLVSIAGSGWSCVSNTCARNDVLSAGAHYPPIAVAVNVASNASSPQVNHATVSGGGSIMASASDSTTILFPSLNIAKTHTGSFTQGQQSATYTITVSNTGGATPTLGTVSVTDTLPTGLTLVSISGTGWLCVSVTCMRNDTLMPGGGYPPLTVAVNVSSIAPSSLTNVAVVSGGASSTSSASDATNISPPIYTLSGSVRVAGAGLGGVTVSLSGTFSGSTVTDTSGNYSFSGLFGGGTYTLSAVRGGYSFSAPINFSNLSSNQTANFTGVEVAGLEFYSVPPCRVADTRAAAGFPSSFGAPTMSAGQTRTFPVPLSDCGIPSNAAVYSLNFTVVPPTAGGYLGLLTTYPTGQSRPNASTLNSHTGTVVANAAIVPAGTNGSIDVYVSDRTDVLFDIDGYFAPQSSNGLQFYPVSPCRVVDTRPAAGFASPFGAPTMTAGQTRAFPVPSSSCGIPSNASAYSFNFTVLPPTPGYLGLLTTWPVGPAQPNASTLNSYNGTVVANAAIVPAGTSGAVNVYVSDKTDVLFDVDGYFAPQSTGGLNFYPVGPCRIADTRLAAGFPSPFGGSTMTAGQTRTFPIPPSSCGIPSNAAAYSLNFTVVPPIPGYLGLLTTWPAGQARPNASTLNSYTGTVVANAAIVPAGTGGAINVYVSDVTDVIFDINGYFAP